eukprot:jgi/Chlat1/4708/Chrsp30S04754
MEWRNSAVADYSSMPPLWTEHKQLQSSHARKPLSSHVQRALQEAMHVGPVLLRVLHLPTGNSGEDMTEHELRCMLARWVEAEMVRYIALYSQQFAVVTCNTLGAAIIVGRDLQPSCFDIGGMLALEVFDAITKALEGKPYKMPARLAPSGSQEHLGKAAIARTATPEKSRELDADMDMDSPTKGAISRDPSNSLEEELHGRDAPLALPDAFQQASAQVPTVAGSEERLPTMPVEEHVPAMPVAERPWSPVSPPTASGGTPPLPPLPAAPPPATPPPPCLTPPLPPPVSVLALPGAVDILEPTATAVADCNAIAPLPNGCDGHDEKSLTTLGETRNIDTPYHEPQAPGSVEKFKDMSSFAEALSLAAKRWAQRLPEPSQPTPVEENHAQGAGQGRPKRTRCQSRETVKKRARHL